MYIYFDTDHLFSFYLLINFFRILCYFNNSSLFTKNACERSEWFATFIFFTSLAFNFILKCYIQLLTIIKYSRFPIYNKRWAVFAVVTAKNGQISLYFGIENWNENSRPVRLDSVREDAIPLRRTSAPVYHDRALTPDELQHVEKIRSYIRPGSAFFRNFYYF